MVKALTETNWLGVGKRAMWLLALIALIGTGGLAASDILKNGSHITETVQDAVTTGPLSANHITRFGAHYSNFSECIGLSVTVRRQPASLRSALQSNAILWQSPKPICDGLKDYLAGEEVEWFAYQRYWHGYRIVNQVILSFASYDTLQRVCLMLVLLSLGTWIWAQSNLVGWKIAAGLGGLVLLVTDIANVYVTPTHAISLSVLFFAASAITFRVNTAPFTGLLLTCFAAGAAYNFFDFLYNPDLLMLLGGMAIAIASIGRGELHVHLIYQIFAGQVAIISGYIGMWISKWLITFFGQAFSEMANWFPINDLLRWVAGGSEPYVPFKSIATLAKYGWAIGLNSVLMPLLAVATLCFATILVLRGRWAVVPILGLCALLPIGILEIKSAHTIAHDSFTFRTLPIAVVIISLSLLWSIRSLKQRPFRSSNIFQ